MPDDAPVIEETVGQEIGEIIQTNIALKQSEQPDLMGDLPKYTFAQVNDMLVKSKIMQELDEAADCISYVSNDHHQDELWRVYHSLRHSEAPRTLRQQDNSNLQKRQKRSGYATRLEQFVLT